MLYLMSAYYVLSGVLKSWCPEIKGQRVGSTGSDWNQTREHRLVFQAWGFNIKGLVNHGKDLGFITKTIKNIM